MMRNNLYIEDALEKKEIEKLLRGEEPYAFPQSIQKAEDYIPTDCLEVVLSIIEYSKANKEVIDEYERTLIDMLRHDVYSFYIAYRSYYFYLVQGHCGLVKYELNEKIFDILKEEYSRKREEITNKGIEIYNGKYIFPAKKIEKIIRVIESDFADEVVFEGVNFSRIEVKKKE